jgi:hypothetical protein
VSRLKEEVFKGSAYVVTSVDTNSPLAALVFGNSRSNDTAAIHREVRAALVVWCLFRAPPRVDFLSRSAP